MVQSYHLLTHSSKWLLSLFLHSSVASSTAGRVGSQTTSPTNPTFLLQNRDPRTSFSQQPRNPNTTQNLEATLDSLATLRRRTLPLTPRSPRVRERLRPAPAQVRARAPALVLPGRRQSPPRSRPVSSRNREALSSRWLPGGVPAPQSLRAAADVRGAHAAGTRRANDGCALRAEEQRRSCGGGARGATSTSPARSPVRITQLPPRPDAQSGRYCRRFPWGSHVTCQNPA